MRQHQHSQKYILIIFLCFAFDFCFFLFCFVFFCFVETNYYAGDGRDGWLFQAGKQLHVFVSLFCGFVLPVHDVQRVGEDREIILYEELIQKV